jgi:hypothetical protein
VQLILEVHAGFAVFLQERVGSRFFVPNPLDDAQTLAIISAKLTEILILVEQAPYPGFRIRKPPHYCAKRILVSVFGHRTDFLTNPAETEVTLR